MVKLIDFSAVWCGQCKVYSKIIDQVGKEFPDMEILRVDAEDRIELSDKYQVRSLPTTVILKDDKVVFKRSGIIPKPELFQIIKNIFSHD